MRQTVHLYALCWNDVRMLPFFFKHYNDIVDRYFIFDNGSTDGTLNLLTSNPSVTLRHFETEQESFGLTEVNLNNRIWKESADAADWVIVVDVDEHIYHSDLAKYLAKSTEEGVTVHYSIGYDMVSLDFPHPEGRLSEGITKGIRSIGYDKLCIFNPRAVENSNFYPGKHRAAPDGRIVWPKRREILLLHYKRMGLDYLRDRHNELSTGLGPIDREHGFGIHYTWSEEQTRADFESALAMAQYVPLKQDIQKPGLLPPFADPATLAEKIVALGLFDAQFYLKVNADVAAVSVDPALHFCSIGWKELRDPNPFFSTARYLGEYGETYDPSINPLCHYLDEGERLGLKPSRDFDPIRYRQAVSIPHDDSPLLFFLASIRTSSGLSVSEMMDWFVKTGLFDAEFYLSRNADVAKSMTDPVRHFCTYGWWERRNPNAFFDMEWYITKYGAIVPITCHPLLHYMTVGEAVGLWPSQRFDPRCYRMTMSLPKDVLALSHFLVTQKVGREAACSQPSNARSPSVFNHRLLETRNTTLIVSS